MEDDLKRLQQVIDELKHASAMATNSEKRVEDMRIDGCHDFLKNIMFQIQTHLSIAVEFLFHAREGAEEAYTILAEEIDKDGG